jgi:hypothetical protein
MANFTLTWMRLISLRSSLWRGWTSKADPVSYAISSAQRCTERFALSGVDDARRDQQPPCATRIGAEWRPPAMHEPCLSRGEGWDWGLRPDRVVFRNKKEGPCRTDAPDIDRAAFLEPKGATRDSAKFRGNVDTIRHAMRLRTCATPLKRKLAPGHRRHKPRRKYRPKELCRSSLKCPGPYVAAQRQDRQHTRDGEKQASPN